MGNDVDLILLIQQLPHLSKIVTASHVHPETQRANLYEQVQEHQELSHDQVQEIEKKEKSKQVEEDDSNSGQQMHGEHERREEEPEEPDQPASNASPWSGNLLNLKV
ncbi:hypothetical protein dsx2_2824 [Desulfovibrio sp. X2]|uniref:hypothetical protein n=1 Tax=Desulfovibrio sp. X2 TaxID=941449 RepID=UPI000358F364|nr:hypothetical protein [Desulfovibrio sp. X2]EPR42435.1 hypothetical protein dsx2_2824 [Desulfovibrio sp. X2]